MSVCVVVTAVMCSASGIDDPLRFIHLDGTGTRGGAREGKFNMATRDRAWEGVGRLGVGAVCYIGGATRPVIAGEKKIYKNL